jgi:hypothetical protein
MRTTVDLPDNLYRSLKARAALRGVTLKQLIQSLIEQALSGQPARAASGREDLPPAIIPAQGKMIGAISKNRLRRLDEEEDEARDARSVGR